MIIGLTGLKGSGKDTVAAYLIKHHGFERRAFADPLKRSFAALFDIPMNEIEMHKNDPTVVMAIGYKNAIVNEEVDAVFPHVQSWSPISSFTFREALQRYGTESHRDVFGEDFWVNLTLPVGAFYGGRAIVVTDLRFENEAERMNELRGFVVRVERPILGEDQDLHKSELGQAMITPHYRLQNDSTLNKLYEEIDEMLDKLTEL